MNENDGIDVVAYGPDIWAAYPQFQEYRDEGLWAIGSTKENAIIALQEAIDQYEDEEKEYTVTPKGLWGIARWKALMEQGVPEQEALDAAIAWVEHPDQRHLFDE